MRQHFMMFAAYNQWANGRIYDAAAELDDEEFNRNVGAFFGSMMGTLNHLLTADRIWMKRFTGEGEAPDRLDTILHERLADLSDARQAEDRRIVAWVGSLDEARLKGVIRYRRVSTPDEFVQPLMPALDHWFNHQTHHRGQAHVILTSLGKKAPELDLLYYQREVEAGRA
jgi:uncharacterized damage-inducible protein DinB